MSRVLIFRTGRIYALRKPKTNIQILQQNVLLKYKYLVAFLRQHGREVYAEVRAAYVDTLSRVLSSHFRAYLAALERLQVIPSPPLPSPPIPSPSIICLPACPRTCTCCGVNSVVPDS